MIPSKASKSVSVSLNTASTRPHDRAVAVTLNVEYTDEYPEAVPRLSIEVQHGELDENEIDQLIGELNKVVRLFLAHEPGSPQSSNK